MGVIVIILWTVIIVLSVHIARKLFAQKQLYAGDGLGILGIVISLVIFIYTETHSSEEKHVNAPAQPIAQISSQSQVPGGAEAVPSVKSESIELADLISKFSGQSSIPWDTGAEPGSPITWHTEGRAPERKVGRKTIGPDTREGEAIITIDGAPWGTHLGTVATPGRWTIIAGGPNAGINEIYISTQEFGGTFDLVSYLEHHGLQVTTFPCPSTAGQISQWLKISKDSWSFWIEESQSSGSAGYMEDLYIHLFVDEKEEVKCED